MYIAQVGEPSKDAKQKIRDLAQADIPIEKRRALYNRLERRMKHGNGLKPGLVEKYVAAASSRKERFALLKEFLIDENMCNPQRFYWSCVQWHLQNFSTALRNSQHTVLSSRSEVHVEAYFVQWGSHTSIQWVNLNLTPYQTYHIPIPNAPYQGSGEEKP